MLSMLWLVAIALFLPPAAFGQAVDTAVDAEKNKPKLRFVCISCLAEDQKVVLASHDEKGGWKELGEFSIRSSFITAWVPAMAGELHLALREEGTLKSICHFSYPAGTRRGMAILTADLKNQGYRANVIDPEKLAFAKGSVLLVNFSPQSGVVLLGSNKVAIQAGQQLVAKPALEDNGMYRMMVAYIGADKKPVPCYDRYTQGNPDSRDILFLLPDHMLGLRALSFPIFGELD